MGAPEKKDKNLAGKDVTMDAGKNVSKAEAKAESKDAKSKAPPKPDEAAYNKRIAEIDANIELKKEEMKVIQKVIDKRSEGKEKYDEQRSALYDRMNAIKSERQGLADQRKTHRDSEKEMRDRARQSERGMKDLSRSAEDLNEETLCEKIAAIEYKLSVTSMTLKEEKGLMMEIKKLKARKPEAARISRELEAAKVIHASETSGQEAQTVQQQMTTLTERIVALEKESDQSWEAIQALKAERQKQTAGVEVEIAKKDTIKAEIDGFWNDKKAIFSEVKAAKDAWYQHQKAERAAKQAKWLEEKKRADAEWEAERAKQELEKPNPYLNEVTLVQQTLEWCRERLGLNDKTETEDTKDLTHVNPEGSMILLNKKDRDTEMYFTGTKKKNLKKKHTANKDKEKIKHTADTLQVFDELKIAAPMTLGDVPSLQEQLEKMLAE